MSKLTTPRLGFLLKYKSKLFKRNFLLDTFMLMEELPTIYCSPDELVSDTITSSHILFNQWRVKTGIVEWVPPTEDKSIPSLMVETRDLFIAFNLWRNFVLMPSKLKTEADVLLSKSLPYTTNEELFRNHLVALAPQLTDSYKDDPSAPAIFFQYRNSLLGTVVRLMSPKKTVIAYLDGCTDEGLVFRYLKEDDQQRVFDEIDTFTLQHGVCPNYNPADKAPLVTTVGRFMANFCVLARAFGNQLDYINGAWDFNKIDTQLSHLLIKKELTIEQFKCYQNHLFFYGHFTELCVPSFSRKSFSTSPEVAKRKKELLEQYKGRLEDPEVISIFEDTLIKLDKEYLNGDSSLRFYTPLGGKSFDIHRKKMYLTVGGITSFEKGSSNYTFIENSLSQGWDKTKFPAICNEIRKGSFDRGHETQLGGAQTKYIVRVFQDSAITMDDCGTDHGVTIDFKTIPIESFIKFGRSIAGSDETIDDTNIDQYRGKVVKLRSPMTCAGKDGYCYKCAGEVFKLLDAKALNMFAVDISSTFTNMALKNMHGTALELFEIEDLEKFIL